MSEEAIVDPEQRLQAVEKAVQHLYTILQVRPSPTERLVPQETEGTAEGSDSQAAAQRRRR